MTTPIHYLLVGLPYSGKSTLANELLKRGNFAHVNIDQLKWDRGFKEVGDNDVPDKVWGEIFTEADSLLKKYLTQGLNVANEYAWITKAWRDCARKVATQVGCETKIIYLKLPVHIIMDRWTTNASNKSRFQWPKNEMQDILRDFEEPNPDENLLIYDQSLPVKEWITQNIPMNRFNGM